MNPFKNLSQEALLIALTEYYERYRRVLEFGGGEDEFVTAKLSLQCILDELNSRMGPIMPILEREERKDFTFDRIDTKAD